MTYNNDKVGHREYLTCSSLQNRRGAVSRISSRVGGSCNRVIIAAKQAGQDIRYVLARDTVLSRRDRSPCRRRTPPVEFTVNNEVPYIRRSFLTFSSSFFCKTHSTHVITLRRGRAAEVAHLLLLTQRCGVPAVTSCEWGSVQRCCRGRSLTAPSAPAMTEHSPSVSLRSPAASSAPSGGPSPAGCHL